MTDKAKIEKHRRKTRFERMCLVAIYCGIEVEAMIGDDGVAIIKELFARID